MRSSDLAAGTACLVLALSAASLLHGQETVLVDERFADGDRGGYKPPESLEWAASSKLNLDDGRLTIRRAGSTARHAVARFTEAGKPVVLESGQSLELAFDFTPLEEGKASGNSLRFGLFELGTGAGPDFLSDGWNPEDCAAPGYVGVLSYYGGESSEIALLQRRDAPGRLLTNSKAYVPLGKKKAAAAFAVGQTYSCLLRVTRNGRKITLFTRISGGDLAAPLEISSATPSKTVTRFDTVGFSIFRPFASGGISNIRLVLRKNP
jgi:hypothetical protein